MAVFTRFLCKKISIVSSEFVRSQPREGVIIECPLNGQFHDARDVILTSWTDIRGMNDDDDDDVQ